MSPLILPISFAERFDSLFQNRTFYAPLTIGCPSMTQFVDRQVFKKEDKDKTLLATLKAKLPKTRGYKFVTQFKGSF